MKIKKRRKSSRHAGSQTHGRGAKERTRGSGNQGGKGWAGTGKRGDQKKTLVIHLFGNNYFGKDKTLRRGSVAPKPRAINLSDIEERMPQFIAEKKAKENKGVYALDLTGYKILGKGEISIKLNVTATSASTSAAQKIKKADGTLTLVESNQKKTEESTK